MSWRAFNGRDAQPTRRFAATALALLALLAAGCSKRRSQARKDGTPSTTSGQRDAEPAPTGDAPTYEQACADPNLRSGYLQLVSERATIPYYVRRIDYLDEAARDALLGEPRRRAHPAFATIPDDPGAQRPVYAGGRLSRVLVLPGAFDCERVGGEIQFLLGLIDHEFAHARHAMLGLRSLKVSQLTSLPPATATWLFGTLSELEAHREEIRASRKYQLPASYYTGALGHYLEYYLDLFDKSHELDPALRTSLQAELFEDWMPRQERIFFRDGKRWCFEIEGKRYDLPAAVVEKHQDRKAPAGRDRE